MSWRRFLRRAWWDDERARELEAHLEIDIDENVARGMPPDEARAAARRRLGNVTRIREDIYDMNTLGWIETSWRDLRHGARLLRRSPGFTTVAVLSLALGIGANAAIFQLIDTVRLRALPVKDPEQLVEVRIVDATEGRTGSFRSERPALTYPLWEGIRREQQAFSGMAAWAAVTFDLSSGGEGRPAQGLFVSGSFFDTLGVKPAAGRLLSESDDFPGCGPRAAVVSYAFWQREFGGDPGVTGRTVALDGHVFPIAGVAPPRFFGVHVGRTFDVAVPICSESVIHVQSSIDQRDYWWLAVVGRLKPGWTADRASAQLAAISPGLFQATMPPRYNALDARRYAGFHLGTKPASTGVSSLTSTYGAPLWVLLATTAIVLLVACANLANLMLARATARERELAVRLAIGASRGRIVRQLLTESVVLAAAGAASGALLAVWLSRFLVSLLSTGTNGLFLDLSFDWRVFAYTSALAIVTVLLFGLLPALRATRAGLAESMKAGARGSGDGAARLSLRRSLVVVQVALSVVLVIGSLLFVRTLRNLTKLDAGFDTSGILSVDLDLRRAPIAPERRTAVYEELTARVAALPGVRGAAQAFMIPLNGNGWNQKVIVDGVPQPGNTLINRVSPGYFAVMRTPLVSGRDFDARDRIGAPPVAVVTETFVRRYLGGGRAVGRTFSLQAGAGEPQPVYEIVGVVRDSKYGDLREPFDALVYLAAGQEEHPTTDLLLAVRADGPLTAVTSSITATVSALSPAIVIRYDTMDRLVRETLIAERLMAVLSGLFGGLAALIAMVGLYGVMAYAVARRRTEIGVRMALGAGRGDVVGMVLREACVLLGAGAAAGVVLAVASGRAVAPLLYGLAPSDPTTMAVAIGAMAGVGVLASWLPARSAAAVDPATALRAE